MTIINYRKSGVDLDTILMDPVNKDLVPVNLRKDVSTWEPSGTHKAWGINNYGQLGTGGGDTNSLTGMQSIFSGRTWTSVRQTGYHGAALDEAGRIWHWGMHPNIGNLSSPVIATPNSSWKSVSVGQRLLLGVRSDGTLWSWGRNNYGQLGLGDTTERSSLIQVGALTNWKSVYGGNDWAYAIKSDGTLWSWGRNNYGQLGLGDTTDRSSPVQIGAATDWNYLSAGMDCSVFAVRTSNQYVFAWGKNGYGRLGTGTTVDRSSPVQIRYSPSGGISWVSMTVKNGLFIDQEQMFVMGNNSSGRLGLGDTTNRSSPTLLGSGIKSGVINDGALAYIKTNGTLWTSGSGSLNLNGTTRSSPGQIGSSNNWVAVYGEGNSFSILQADKKYT